MPYQIFEIQLQGLAAAVRTNPHQQRLQQSLAVFFIANPLCCTCWCLPPLKMSLTTPMCTYADITYAHLPASLCTAQYTNSEFTSQPFTRSSKASCGSTGNFSDPWSKTTHPLWMM